MSAVEWKTLDELGLFYGGLSGKTKEDFQDGNAKFITYMNIYSNPSLNLKCNDKVRVDVGEKQNTVQYGDVLFTGSSETPEECGMSSVVTELIDEPIYLNSFCFGFRLNDINIFEPKFLKHYFRCNSMRALIATTASGVTRFNVSKKRLGRIQIPLPSLSRQQAIVSHLDTFTTLISSLESELEKRRKQYEHYRNQLLEFEGVDGVEWKTLGEVAKNLDRLRRPITASKRVTGCYPYYGASGIVDYVEGYIFDGNYLLVSEDGANLVMRSTPIAFAITGKNWVNNHAHVLEFSNIITQKLIEIYLNSMDLTKYISGGAQPKLNQDNLNSIIVPIPSLSTQQAIVEKLDTFEQLIQSLESEIKLRKQQYEYYREKLLTFE